MASAIRWICYHCDVGKNANNLYCIRNVFFAGLFGKGFITNILSELWVSGWNAEDWTMAGDFALVEGSANLCYVRGESRLPSIIGSARSRCLLVGFHLDNYPAGSRSSSTRSSTLGATAKAMSASHNSMNQITALGGGGRTRLAGSLDEPGQVSVGIVGQGDKPARMLSGNRFETELDLPPGTSTLQITAADGSANLASKQYSVVTSPETSRTVTHDADGNMTSDGVRTYEWDTWSRLTKITWATGKTTTFHYNALGERTKIVHTDGSTTRTEYYLYDGPRPIQRRSEGTATSNIDREYFSEGERRWNNGTSSWTHHHYCRDHLGSVREVLDSSGTLLARYDYAPYGERVTRYEASGYSSDIGFTGHFLLPSPVPGQSEIVLAHYRAYVPVLGRWLSQDPIFEVKGVLGETLPEGPNLYAYAGGDVVGSSDPFGLDTVVCIGLRTKGNPFGHTAMAFTGKGVYSFGTGAKHPLGSSFTKYLEAQATYRDSVLYVIPTTKNQEEKMVKYLKNLENVPLPDAHADPKKAIGDNCNTRAMGALAEGGINLVGISSLPAELQRKLEMMVNNSGKGFAINFKKGTKNASNWGVFDPPTR